MPEGYGFLLPKKSDVVVQVHYHRDGRVEHDRLQIGLYFAKKSDRDESLQDGRDRRPVLRHSRRTTPTSR